MITPTISSRRLSLRPLTRSTPRQISWLTDPEVIRYSEQRHQQHNLKTQLRYVDTFSGQSHLWAIHVVATGDHIGNLSVSHDPHNDVGDVGILIGERKCWGLGMGTEAWNAACGWLLDPLCGNIRKLEAGCMRENVAMMKILTGGGFKFEGERANHFLLEGRPVGMVLFGRLR